VEPAGRQRSQAKAASATSICSGVPSAAGANRISTAAMSPTTAAFTTSSVLRAAGRALHRSTIGPVVATSTNAGRKIATVATTAPGKPATR